MRCKIKPICFQEELPPLIEAAAADAHYPIAPTHIVWKNGEIGGYASMGGCPTMHLWSNTKNMKAIDSVRCLRYFEDLGRAMGWSQFVTGVSPTSPFHPLFERLGYHKVFDIDVTIFGKVL